MSIYSGDEQHGDEITSGPINPHADALRRTFTDTVARMVESHGEIVAVDATPAHHPSTCPNPLDCDLCFDIAHEHAEDHFVEIHHGRIPDPLDDADLDELATLAYAWLEAW